VTTPQPTSETPTTTVAPGKVTDIRLPTSISPIRYTLELKPDFYGANPDEFTFEGHVRVDMLCVESTPNITLHANALNISTVEVSRVDGGQVPDVVMWSRDEERQFLVVHLDGALEENTRYELAVSFSGPMSGVGAHGLYANRYTVGNETRYGISMNHIIYDVICMFNTLYDVIYSYCMNYLYQILLKLVKSKFYSRANKV
jgi:aminopeptidase N